MPLDVLLLILRVISAALLLGILVALFTVMWRELRATTHQAVAARRTYGKLSVIQQIDGQYLKSSQSYPLLPLTSLGRAPTNSIVLDDTFASGDHALVALRDGRWWVEDRGSRNGTLVNDIPVSEPMIITHGDVLMIGGIRLLLELESAPPSSE